jgi:hypothetical protein
LNPVWNEKLEFPKIKDSQQSLKVTVEDHNDYSLASFIGRIAIPIGA